MLSIVKQSNKIAFSVDASILTNTLTRISAVASFGQTSSSTKQYLLVIQNKQLYLVGLTQDVMAYINIPATAKDDGLCVIEADIMLGLLKKRKGIFEFQTDSNVLKFNQKVGKYGGEINLTEITDDIVEAVNDIDATSSAVTLEQETLSELKRAVKIANAKDIIFDSALPVHITVKKGKLKATSQDGYHAILYVGRQKLDCADFQLSITGTAYSVIEKFVANESVSFAIDSHMRITKKDTIFASIPSIQSEDDDYLIYENLLKLQKTKQRCSFVFNGSIYETISNMFALKPSSLDNTTKFNFAISKSELSVEYKTTVGQITESFEISDFDGKKFSFGVHEKQVKDIFEVFSMYSEVVFTVYDGRFLLEAGTDKDQYYIKALGTFDD